MGDESSFTKELADKICQEVSEGKSCRLVCRELNIPQTNVRYWYLHDVQGFAAQYARAREAQMEAWADEITEISDDGTNDWMTIKRGGEDVEVPNQEVLQRSRLRVDTRKWLMSKIAPKKYGERIEQRISGADGGPVQFSWKSR